MVMKKKKYMKKAKGRILVMFVFFGAIISTLGYTLISNLQQINDMRKEKVALKEEENDLKEEEKSLEADIARLSDSEYIARYAREKYFYSKEGELILRIDD